jgi:hypothetical protein
MRDELLGYLLDALEPHERADVEEKLAQSPELQNELVLLSRALEPLECGGGHYDPVPGLADRTCQMIMHRQAVVLRTVIEPRGGEELRPAESGRGSRWSFADFAVAAGIVLAVTMIFFPAISQSRYSARLVACQDNLRQIGVALAQYSGFHNGLLPDVETEKNLALPGLFAAQLNERQLLSNPRTLICPASDQVNAAKFHVPSIEELRNARGQKLAELRSGLKGGYGYNLGYVNKNHAYQPAKHLQRSTFALMADAPQIGLPSPRSINHGNGGQNVLFEDGHADYLTTTKTQAGAGLDHIFLNDRGHVAAGLHQNDAVIVDSAAEPISLVEDDAPSAVRESE